MKKHAASKNAGSDGAEPLVASSSGTIKESPIDPIVEDLLEVFERRREKDIISDLLYSLDRLGHRGQSSSTDMSAIAFGIDTNVLIKIAKDKEVSESMISYFGSHAFPIILPGQAVQEFWNNMSSFMETASSKLDKAFDQFKDVIRKTKIDFRNHIEDIEQNLLKFETEYKGIYGKSVLDDVKRIIDDLKENVIVSYCPRYAFYDISVHRDSTKTPPGFKDEKNNYGDFFIWVDFLYGLKKLQNDGYRFEKVVLVTDDGKPDWVSGNAEHPILVFEVRSILDVPFEIWKSSKFIEEINRQTIAKPTS